MVKRVIIHFAPGTFNGVCGARCASDTSSTRLREVTCKRCLKHANQPNARAWYVQRGHA